MELPQDLLNAYTNARYDISLGDSLISLSCSGVVAGDVSLFFKQPVAVISAWNPSAGASALRLQSDEENSSAHSSLLRYLERSGHEFYPARNSAPDGSFMEASVAVFGLSREQAACIGRSYGQAAVFYFGGSKTDSGEILPCGADLLSYIRRLPLIELHIHSEGAIPPAHMLKLLRVKGGEEAGRIQNESDLFAFLRYRNFYEFIQKWLWTLSLIRAEDDYADIVFEVMKSLKEQGVVHAELHFSPFDFVDGRLKAPAIVDAAISGLARACNELSMSGCLIADLVRNHPVETARQRIDSIAPFLGRGLVGLGLGGNEAKFPASLFADAFAYARSLGFRTVAHAGETAGADSVKSALLDLRAERIGHGLQAMDNPDVIALLRDRSVPVEVCLSSNEATGVVDSIKDHPLRRMLNEGLRVSLHSDDPTMFRTSLLNEFRLFVSDFGANQQDISQVVRNAVASSFADESSQKGWLGRI